MKTARHRTEQGPVLAVVEGGDLLIDLPPGGQLTELLAEDGLLAECGEQARRLAAWATALAGADLLASLDPSRFRGFSTFPEHTAGVVKLVDPSVGVPPESWEIPTFCFSNPYAIVGPRDDVPIPPGV